MAHRLVRSFIFVILFVASYCACNAAEFCADLKIKVGDKLSSGRVFVKGDYIRMDIKEGGKTFMTMLAQNGCPTIWYYDSDLKLYWSLQREVPYNLLNCQSECASWQGADCGIAKIDGVKCRKIVYPTMGGKETRWYSEKLKVPVKIASERLGKRFVIQYCNIKQNKQREDIFMIPGGYQNREPDYWTKFKSVFGN
ncbi:hypothetical protein LLG46_01935 [bacterium]|nr:hypothetical protein [bacterium]